MNRFIKLLFLGIITTFSMTGCSFSGQDGNVNESSKEKDVYYTIDFEGIDKSNARNSLDYAGTYKGILPCADCAGIAIEIKLSYDGTFKKTMQYLGKNDDVFISDGAYIWDNTGNIISLEGVDRPNQFFVSEERLIHLDINGQRITGDLSDHYVLYKTY